MARERTPATADQAKALANPLRLRILRLCLDEARTNQQLAKRLDIDPSTSLYHVRLLLDAGFIEAAEPRRSPTGATEKPYRATGLSWTLDIGLQHDASLAMFEAFRAELFEAGPASVVNASRFALHLDETALAEFTARLQALLDEFTDNDHDRRSRNMPAVGGMLMMHVLNDDHRR